MRTLLAVTVVLAVACGSKSEPAGPPPTADAVLEADLEATGGRAAWTAIETMRVRGRLKLPAAGVEGTFWVISKAPNLKRMHIEIPGAGAMDEGCDGKVAWERNRGQSVRLATGDELARELRETAIKSLDWRREYESIEMAGPATFAGRPAWKVVARMPGLVKTMYFDRTTKLQIGEERAESGGGETTNTRLRLSDYRTYGTIKQPARVEVIMGGDTMEPAIDEVELGAAAPPDEFAPPADGAERP